MSVYVCVCTCEATVVRRPARRGRGRERGCSGMCIHVQRISIMPKEAGRLCRIYASAGADAQMTEDFNSILIDERLQILLIEWKKETRRERASARARARTVRA